jgi:hypothetical protein
MLDHTIALRSIHCHGNVLHIEACYHVLVHCTSVLSRTGILNLLNQPEARAGRHGSVEAKDIGHAMTHLVEQSSMVRICMLPSVWAKPGLSLHQVG